MKRHLWLAALLALSSSVSAANSAPREALIDQIETQYAATKGSTMDELIRSSLESVSDNELQALRQVLSEPSFKKFQAAMSGPAAQQLHAGTAKVGMQLGAAINAVLVSHHLNDVH